MIEKIEDWYVWNTKITGSTNDDALNFCLPEGGREKFVFSAEQQTKGRGRFDHKWESKEGNLLFSMLFPAEIQTSGALSLLCGYCVLQTIRHFAPNLNLSLKWPNDVFIDDKKVCGILIERKDENYVVAGIGVNLKYAPKLTKSVYEAVSLKDFGILPDKTEFLTLFLQEFNRGLEIIEKREFNAIRKNWLEYAKGLHKKVRLENLNKKVSGEFVGVDDDGAIIIKNAKKEAKYVAGELYYEEG